MRAVLVFAVSVMVAAQARAEEKQPARKAAQALVDQAWGRVKPPQLKPRVSFTAELTPPLPEVWPPDGHDRLVFYVYARGFGPGLADGERITAPWARVYVESDRSRLEALSSELRLLGVQGVHPVAAGTFPMPEQRSEAEEAVATLARVSAVGPPTRLIQLNYCSWALSNGVIAASVRGRHEAFFRWLGCR